MQNMSQNLMFHKVNLESHLWIRGLSIYCIEYRVTQKWNGLREAIPDFHAIEYNISWL